MKSKKTFSDLLREQRTKKGLTKKEAADIVGLPYTTYNNYENGREPKQAIKNEIASKLEIPISELLDSETVQGVMNERIDDSVKYYADLYNENKGIDLQTKDSFSAWVFLGLNIHRIVEILSLINIQVLNPLAMEQSVDTDNWRKKAQVFSVIINKDDTVKYYISLDDLLKLQDDVESFIEFSIKKYIV